MTTDDIVAAFYAGVAAYAGREETPQREVRAGLASALQAVADHLEDEGRAWSAAEVRAIVAMIAPG